MSRLFFKKEIVSDFEEKIRSLTASFKSNKIQARQTVALLFSDNLHFITAYEACRNCSLIPLVLRNKVDVTWLKRMGVAYLCYFDKGFKLVLIQKNTVDTSHDIAVICQTSGTTNTPKCVPWTHKSIDYQSKITFEAMKYEKDDRLMTTLSLTSSYGLSLIHLWQRYPISLILSNVYYPSSLLEVALDTKATSFDSVPQIYFGLQRKFQQKLGLNVLDQIRLWCSGGDFLPLELCNKWLETTKKPLLDGYGLTEAGPNVSLNTLDQYRVGSVGKPLDQTRVRLSSAGELLVSSPSCIQSYWTNPAVDCQKNGWLATGDIGEIDSEGYVFIKGRVKNKIVVNGTTIFAEEVEATLLQHLSIQTIVTPVKTKYGDKLGLLVLQEEGITVDKNHIKQVCKNLIAGNVVPKSIQTIDRLPLSSTGKVDRLKAHKILSIEH